MRNHFNLDGRNNFGRKVRGQALNDVKELQDFLLPHGINLVVQQLDFELHLHINPVVVLCILAVDFRLTILAHHNDGRCIGGLE